MIPDMFPYTLVLEAGSQTPKAPTLVKTARKFARKKLRVAEEYLVEIKDAGELRRGIFATKEIKEQQFLEHYEPTDTHEAEVILKKLMFEYGGNLYFDERIGGDWTSLINDSLCYGISR